MNGVDPSCFGVLLRRLLLQAPSARVILYAMSLLIEGSQKPTILERETRKREREKGGEEERLTREREARWNSEGRLWPGTSDGEDGGCLWRKKMMKRGRKEGASPRVMSPYEILIFFFLRC